MALASPDLDRVAAFLKSGSCRSVVVLAGAGASTGAGIPDFRSQGGFYETLQPDLLTASDDERARMTRKPEAAVSRAMFMRNQLPYLELRRPFILGTERQEWKATLTHWFIKFLEEEGLLTRLYTQNIDGLEYQTGIDPELLVEVHGSVRRASCEGCSKEMRLQDFAQQVKAKIKDIYKVDPDAPGESAHIFCEHCEKPLVKPSTVQFGGALPHEFKFHASDDFPCADLLIIIGTSLTVAPANAVVQQVPQECLRLILNDQPVGEDLGICYRGESTRDIWAGPCSCDEAALGIMKRLGWEEKVRRIRHRLPESSRVLVASL